MKLEQEMLFALLSKYEMQVTFPNLEVPSSELVESQAIKALGEIRGILQDDTIEDPECFYRIEEIVTLFEGMGMGCGGRHDWA